MTKKGAGMLVISLRDVPTLYSAVKVSFRVALKEPLKNYIFLIPFIFTRLM